MLGETSCRARNVGAADYRRRLVGGMGATAGRRVTDGRLARLAMVRRVVSLGVGRMMAQQQRRCSGRWSWTW